MHYLSELAGAVKILLAKPAVAAELKAIEADVIKAVEAEAETLIASEAPVVAEVAVSATAAATPAVKS